MIAGTLAGGSGAGFKPVFAAAALILVGSVVGGCVGDPAYARIGSTESGVYGYSDVATTDGGHLVRVYLPSWISSAQLPRQYWDQRAQELCGGRIARQSINTARREMERYDQVGGRPGDYVMEGVVYCEVTGNPAA